jgi:hypothetical protein
VAGARPRRILSFLLRRQPNAEDATASFGFLDDRFDLGLTDLSDAREKRPSRSMEQGRY